MNSYPVIQVRNGDCIEFFLYPHDATSSPIAWLHDDADDIVVDEFGFLMTLKLAGAMPGNWTLPVTAAEARMIDAARIPDINL
ncbi:MAG: hypothetical protein M0P72_09730 [Metallibacterium scheffleri]|jgi:hypothetical protein|uniref:hypothetical protein n=1 Tax=Metallibacterium scheffleri TaxID=993689 RepID=UPI0026EEB01F|nr:hypothetical protein [Metallibacterium scheffleri]MCK9367410.1 hypothetical protein [Metallibacterium scheffleri]